MQNMDSKESNSSIRPRTMFTVEQKMILMAAYEKGVNSVNKSQLEAIKNLASQINCDETVIKNWIGNERAKRKRATSHGELKLKPPQKIRVPNCYNLFTADFYKSDEGKALLSLKEKNQQAAEKWRGMSQDDKKQYVDAAKENADMPGDSWREAIRIHHNMQKNAAWAEKCEVQAMYMVYHNNHVYHGGTTKGRKFLSDNSDVSRRFSLAVHTEKSCEPTCAELKSDKAVLRMAVQSLLNAKYALATGNSKAHVPYATMQPSEVIGFPSDIEFKNPSSYGVANLRRILEVADQISFKVHNTDGSQQGTTLAQHVQVHNTSTGGSQQCKTLAQQETIESANPYSPGTALNLFYEGQVIRTGLAMEGQVLHGRSIPSSFQKVAVTEVLKKTELLFSTSFDEEFVTVGEIIVWPLKLMKSL